MKPQRHGSAVERKRRGCSIRATSAQPIPNYSRAKEKALRVIALRVITLQQALLYESLCQSEICRRKYLPEAMRTASAYEGK